MLLQFNETIKEVGLACNMNVCNNEPLIDYISNKIAEMPSLTEDEKSRYESELQKLRQQGAEEGKGNDLENGQSPWMKSAVKNINLQMSK